MKKQNKREQIGIIGAGSWGTTLALLLAKQHSVRVWEYDQKLCQQINQNHENKKFLPGRRIPGQILFTNNIETVIEPSSIILFVIPTHTIRSVIIPIRDKLKNKVLISAAKGIEEKTLKRISEILYEQTKNPEIYVLSGPSHAEEVSKGIPTTVVLASLKKKQNQLVRLQKILNTEQFRVYTNNDIIGVELGGALKNIVAIACGISDGLQFGANTKAAIMTRGLAEIKRLGIKLKARAETFAGLSGIGDLITTCISSYSRNRYVGEQLGKGRSIKDILKNMTMVAEGVKTTNSVYHLAKKLKIDMPITCEIYKIIYKDQDARKAVKALMTREPKAENWK